RVLQAAAVAVVERETGDIKDNRGVGVVHRRVQVEGQGVRVSTTTKLVA
ncbi:MAG: hypothetical protein RLZZ373_2359, partial [Pseudomonadota bacterium]